MIRSWATCLLLICAVALLATCHRPPKTAGATHSTQPAATLAATLQADMPDERQFALLFITRFRIASYNDELAQLAATEMLPAIALAVVSQDGTAAAQLYASQAGDASTMSGVLGAVYGLGCAAGVPAGLWADMLQATPDVNLDTLLTGLAVLDAEPGGPVNLTEDMSSVLVQMYSAPEITLARRAALDALLGTRAGRTIDLPNYIEQAAELSLNSSQWAALLRWADATAWQAILAQQNLNEATRISLAQAAARFAPAGVELPGTQAEWEALGLGVEISVNEYVCGKLDQVPLPEIDKLLGLPDGKPPAFSQEDTAALPKRLTYALQRQDTSAVERVAQVMEQLPDSARSGVLACLDRYNREMLNDEMITKLLNLRDRTVAYWLLLGWHDRPLIMQSEILSMLNTSPNYENKLLANAYQEWRKSN